MSSATSTWGRIIQTVETPLGFFVLALLIVEAFLATVLVGSDLNAEHKFYGMLIGVLMFVLVVSFVFACVWCKPRNLMYDGFAHLVNSGKIPYGTNSDRIAFHELEEMPRSKEE